MSELLSLDEAKAFLEITDSNSDEPLLSVIQAASSACGDYMDRDVLYEDRTEAYSGTNRRMIVTDQYPIQKVTAISVNGNSLDLSLIEFDDRMIYMKAGVFPRGVRNVTVSYGAGLDVIPGAIKQAARYTIKAMFDAAGVDMNSTGQSFAGVLSSTFWPDGAGAVPPSAKVLLSKYARKFTF